MREKKSHIILFSIRKQSINLLTAFCLLLICQLATAQLYPVQTVHNIIPPYSTKLNDYATSFDVKLRLRLIMNDNSINNRQVRLKLKIQGNGLNIQSRDFVVGAPFIFLNGGTQQVLTNIDLSAYFQLNNLIGINPQQYNRPLPDGSYRICWEVYDFLTNQLISNPNMGCDNVFLLLNDPPFLNLPQRGDQLTSATPYINFQWTPRHANATNVSYEFELRELWDTQMDPQASFLASPNYYTQTTYSTTLLYGIGLPELFPGKTYAWRVRAISSTGLSENSVFRNNGYSEIYYFTYANECFPPTMTLAEPLNTGRVKITWQIHPDHNKYHVQYKRADVNDAEWFEVFSYNNQTQIGNLQAGVTYDFRVGGTCHSLTDLNQGYSYSTPNQFTMPTADETVSYSCGIVPEIEITNTTPLGNLGVNETFTAGDFPVTVKIIQGGNGTYTGKGYIVVPYLADTKIAVEFTGIKINTDYQLFDGIIKTTYDPTWSGVESADDFIAGLGGLIDAIYDSLVDALEGLGILDGNYNEENIDFEIADIIVNENGETVIIGTDGEEQNLGLNNNTVVTDENGNVIVVNEDGDVAAVDDGENVARPNVSFKRLSDGLAGEKNIYGYDEVEDSNYDDDHISIENGKTTFCDIKFRRGSKIEDIFLSSEDSLSIKAVFQNDKVKIQSLFKGNKIEKKIYAKSKVDSTIVATLNVNSYKLISRNGKIYSAYKKGDISTKPNDNLDPNTIRKNINEYLKYLVINLTSFVSGVEIPVEYDINGSGSLDLIRNLPPSKQYELNKLYDKFKTKGLKFNDIVRLKMPINRIWKINKSVNLNQKFILVSKNKHIDTSGKGTYAIQSPNGNNKETFLIDKIVGDTIFVQSKFTKPHPITNDLKTSHIIIATNSKTGGLSGNEIKDKPALICGSVDNNKMAIRVTHEKMHEWLRDVNDLKNIMHYTVTGQRIDTKKPFRFKELTPVITGKSEIDRSKPKQNQWELIDRK